LSLYARTPVSCGPTKIAEISTMPDLIDYSFLSDLEGGRTTIGYVPAAAVSKSGVTIATGFDLGQRSEADLKRLGLPANLFEN
jgi:hypothetical protein